MFVFVFIFRNGSRVEWRRQPAGVPARGGRTLRSDGYALGAFARGRQPRACLPAPDITGEYHVVVEFWIWTLTVHAN